MVFVYNLCYFLKALPDQYPLEKQYLFHLDKTRHYDHVQSGTKKQYRIAFSLAALPVFMMFSIFFFVFFTPYPENYSLLNKVDRITGT